MGILARGFDSLHLQKENKTLEKKKFLINEQIKVEKIRVVDEEGKNLGIFSFEEGLKLAQEKGLDLILINERADPPVCKISDFGKFFYQFKKKEKEKKKASKHGEMKTIRLSFNIAEHDLDTKMNQAKNFLEEGMRVRVEMRLKGREKVFLDLAKEKVEKFLQKLENQIQIVKEEDLKSESWGFYFTLKKK